MLIPWIFFGSALAAPGWIPIGPERGHVLDVATNTTQVVVATRVGVLSAGLPITTWQRDPRFPLDTRRLTLAPDGTAWAAPCGQIWRLDTEHTQVARLAAGNIVVDLATTGSGTLLAAIRGSTPQVLRIQADAASGEGQVVLDDIDPWCLLTQGDQVWLGSIEGGLWHSEDDGREFQHVVRRGSVTALGLAGGRVLAAFADGRVLDVERDDTLLRLESVIVTGIADDNGQALLTLAGQHGSSGPVARLVGDALQGVDLTALDSSEGFVRPLGTWSLGDHGALVGTFRQGPLVVQQGEAHMARSGFQATVTGGAAMDSGGRLLLGLMGTGVYLSKDGGQHFHAEHGGMGPVTDAIAVTAMGGALAVLDFEGIALLDEHGQWKRLDSVPNPKPGRRNGLEQLTLGPQGDWWGLDTAGQLYQRHNGTWVACQQGGGFHLGASQDHLHMITARGVVEPTACDQPAELAWSIDTQPMAWDQAMVADDWLAAPGHLWRNGVPVGSLPPARVTAIATRPEEVLLSFATGEILRCDAAGCQPAARSVPNELVAIGWLPDGRIWAAETRGTLLVSEGDADVLPWSNQPGGQPPDRQLQQLETPPWSVEGVRDALGPGVAGGPMPGAGPPQGQPPGAAPSPPTPEEPSAAAPARDKADAVWTLLLLLGAGLASFAWWRKKKR